jgi:hypothetical protein
MFKPINDEDELMAFKKELETIAYGFLDILFHLSPADP